MGGERASKIVRFGEFELDVEAGELYRDGRKVPVHDQPLRILKLLLEKPGEVVSRDEIRRLLWPNGTIVEFVNSVNAAIKKLRTALGEGTEEPRYIETVKRRGYRLIVPVESSENSTSVYSSARDWAGTNTHSSKRIPPLVGHTVSHYRVLDMIGAGGMGVVYRPEYVRLGRQVALKFLLDELSSHPRALERLHSEARSASTLNHPNICIIYEIEEHAGQPFIVMELLEGSTLRERISAGSLSTGDVLDYALQITDGLNAAHREGIVHRDIKPANIFITENDRAKILDFGLAQATELRKHTRQFGPGEFNHLSNHERAAGTVTYMSPEQVLGKGLDGRTDLFSLGVVLYEMTTGKAPFSGDTDEAIFDAILHKTPDSSIGINPDVPPRLDRIVVKCLEKDRDLRYQDALELNRDLQRLKRETDSGRLTLNAKRGATKGSARRWKVLVPAAAVVLVALIAPYFYSHRARGLTNRDTVVLADFSNRTGDAVFDGTLRQGLAVQLGQSPFLSLVSEERIRQTLRLMAQPADARFTPELAREVCERTGSAAVLEGSIATIGSQYVLGLRANYCRTGEVLDEQQVQAARKEDVLNALSQVATKFRTRVGESLAMVEKHDTPLVEVTTPSLDALKAYSTGWKILSSTGSAAALPFFKRAVEIDPKFAMAHGFLGRIYGDLWEFGLSAESSRQAWKLRDRASDREKFWITATYETQVTGNLEQARQTCELWSRTYPRDAAPRDLLPGMIYPVFGKYENAVEEATKAIELDPDFAISYNILALTYQILGRLGEAEDVLHQASRRQLQIPEFLVDRYGFGILEG